MPEIQIYPAAVEDLESLAELKGYYETTHVWQLERTIEDFQISTGFRLSRLPRPVRVDYPRSPAVITQDWLNTSMVLTARLHEKIIGYIRMDETKIPNTIWITDLVIETRQRRQGIATALILSVQDWALQRNIKCITIEMQSKNYPCIQLVHKLGYEFSGYIDHYYTNHDIAVIFSSFIR